MIKAKINGSTREIEFKNGAHHLGTMDGEPFELDCLEHKEGSLSVIRNNESYNVEIINYNAEEKLFHISVNGNKYEIALEDRYDQLLKSLGMDSLASAKVKDMKAPMPGLVLNIIAEAGKEVAKDEPLLILEAMKMENVLKSPADGIIKSIAVEQGQAVEKNEILIHFE